MTQPFLNGCCSSGKCGIPCCLEISSHTVLVPSNYITEGIINILSFNRDYFTIYISVKSPPSPGPPRRPPPPSPLKQKKMCAPREAMYWALYVSLQSLNHFKENYTLQYEPAFQTWQ